jgi:hypothetical protein
MISSEESDGSGEGAGAGAGAGAAARGTKRGKGLRMVTWPVLIANNTF